eukprot:g8715.t1
MAAEIRRDASRAESDWLYTRHHHRCPSSARPHGFDAELAHAIINLTDAFGTFQLDNVIASSSGRRASSLTLPEIVHTCTESLRLLSGPGGCGDVYRRQQCHTGSTSSRQRIAAAAAAADPASYLEDVAREASGGGSSLDEGGLHRGALHQLRVKRAVCEATVDALFTHPSPTGQLLTTRPGSLVVLPSPGAAAAPNVVPSVPSRPLPRRVAFAPLATSDCAANLAHHLAEAPAASLLDTRPPPVRGELFTEEVDEKNPRPSRKAMWPPRPVACNKQAGSERGKFRIAQESEKRRLA